MDLKKVLTVSGKPGLYQLVSQGKNSIIVESLLDKSRMPVFASMPTSSLNDICIFTTNEDMPLGDVFKRIFDTKEGKKIDNVASLDNAALKKCMEDVLPEYDKERVHVSDMKKLFVWYNILHDNSMLSFEEEASQQAETDENKKEE